MTDKSAFESEINKTHRLIARIYNLKLEEMVRAMEDAVRSEEFNEEDIFALLNEGFDVRILQAAAKWVEQNGVTCTADKDDESSELSRRLKDIRNAGAKKIINFEPPR